MAKAYDDLKQALDGYDQASELYEKVAHRPLARESAAQFALEEGDQASANILLNPDTPMETVAQGISLGLERKKTRLDDLVENNFSEILSDPKVKDRLEASLVSYLPKKDLKNYGKLAEYHNIYRNIALYDIRDKLDSARPVEEALGEMAKDVIKHYEDQYKQEKGDSDKINDQKARLKDFFISLYIRDRKSIKEGENLRDKYEEIHIEELMEFKEKMKDQSAVVRYIKATLPEDTETRMHFLRALIS